MSRLPSSLMARTAGLVLGALALGLGLGAAFAGAPENADGPREEAVWNLPAADELGRYNAADYSAVRAGQWWSDGNTNTTEAANSAWRLAGIVRDENTWKALITLPQGGLSVTRSKAGDALPDGGRILSIDASAMQIERNGCRQTVALYTPLPGDACDSTNSGAETPQDDPSL